MIRRMAICNIWYIIRQLSILSCILQCECRWVSKLSAETAANLRLNIYTESMNKMRSRFSAVPTVLFFIYLGYFPMFSIIKRAIFVLNV
jgi:hypothetical protein